MEENRSSDDFPKTAKSEPQTSEESAAADESKAGQTRKVETKNESSNLQPFERWVIEQPARAILFAFFGGLTLALLLRR